MANYDGQVDANDKPGYGNKHGQIASPQGPCGYDIQPGGGRSQKGGEPDGPFGSHKQSSSVMPIVTRDSLGADPASRGGITTPMDTAPTLTGVSGKSDGTGPVSGGGAKISTPLGSPWGDSVG